MVEILKLGTNQNPARKVPVILPTVDKAYKFPTVCPEVLRLRVFSLTAKGETIPNKTPGILNNKSDDKTATT